MKKKKPAKRIESPLHVGNKVFIRSVTHYYTGKIVLLTKDEVVLDAAAWIADTARFSEALKSGAFSEVEPFPDGTLVSIGRGAIVDSCDWKHELPRAVK